jgi:hypothetical protein
VFGKGKGDIDLYFVYTDKIEAAALLDENDKSTPKRLVLDKKMIRKRLEGKDCLWYNNIKSYKLMNR